MTPTAPVQVPASKPGRWAIAVLWTMILVSALYFSAVSIRLHEAHRTHKSDLGQIDQAIWNTSQGRFVQETRGEQTLTRLTDHVEPIFAPVSLVFKVWDDVRALLVLQSVLLAIGAWPVYEIALDRLRRRPKRNGRTATQPQDSAAVGSVSPNWTAAAALAFSAAYLLYPAMQAANVAEFHALPLATPLVLVALLAAQRRRWGWFALTALLVAGVQEGTALLATMLGFYAMAIGGLAWWRSRKSGEASRPAVVWPILLGSVVVAASLAWFYMSTFVIIPAYAAQTYGLGESPYVARYGALGSSFNDVVVSIFTRPGLVLQIAAEPLRLRYLFVLLAPFGFLSLAAPEILLLAAPLLLANLLSAFPFQYSGLLHYSAPLAAYAAVAAIVGAQRLRSLGRLASVGLHNHRIWRAHRRLVFLIAYLLVWSIGCQIAFGFTPIGHYFQYYWASPTAHDRLLARFEAQLPVDAPLSVMPALHPHLSHRQSIYQFPVVADSQYVLLDVAAQSGWAVHPQEMRNTVDELLASGDWTVQDGADGYLLLHRLDPASNETPVTTFPAEFFSFAQADGQPQYPTDITFGGKLRLVGYDIIDNTEWRQTGVRLYWQALEPLPADLQLYAAFVTPDGETVDSSEMRPLIQPIWYAPSEWPVGETIVTHKLPWSLPKEWALGAGAFLGDTWESGARWSVNAAGNVPVIDNNSLALAGIWERDHNELTPATEQPLLEPADELFSGDGWNVQLTGIQAPDRIAPGQDVPIVLQWQSDGPAPRDYNMFVHIVDSHGGKVAQADGPPTHFGQYVTSQWQAGEPVISAHRIPLPADLPPDHYSIVVGWYYWETLERLAHMTDAGELEGDAATVGRLAVDPTAAPSPDLTCAIIPDSCASQ
ncbi:MAG: DUF2079 domain-containing protein [Anaerolineae bacterium]|nr:DUF2079 domain-containing protein [Anaerolineae bacterium]